MTLERLIFEAKYSGPLFLDRSGQVWRDLERKFPEVSSMGVTPEGATFQIRSKSTAIRYSGLSMAITEDFPTSITNVCEIADFLLPSVIKTFELEILDRVGARFVFVLPAKDKSEADTLLQGANLLTISSARIKGFGTQLAEIALKFIAQDDDQGYIFNLASASREINANIPRPVTIDDHRIPRDMLLVDIDRFSRKPVGVGTVSASEFIRVGYRTIETSLNSFFLSGRT